MSYFANGVRLITSTMVRSALVLAVGVFALLAGPADAAPLTFSKSAISQSDETVLTLVRDGCGRGMRFSNRLQACVEAFGGGPRFVEPGCPRGMRFSNSRQACVPAGGGVDPGTAIIQGIIGGVVGAPRGCGPGMRWSNSRQACVWR